MRHDAATEIELGEHWPCSQVSAPTETYVYENAYIEYELLERYLYKSIRYRLASSLSVRTIT